MKKKFEYKESRGLPGGPNEMFTYVTGVFDIYQAPSNIEGEGMFAGKPFKKGDLIGLAHSNGQPVSQLGRMHNHDENSPTMISKKSGNNRFVFAAKDLQPGDELTTNYRMQPELEQPEDFQLGGDVRVPPRKGVRKNPDGSESTHLMATETLDGKNWFSFPTLFQDPDGAWVDMSNRPWQEAYEEAKRRGEVIDFGTDKEAAIKFGEGSWKLPSYQDKGEVVSLSPSDPRYRDYYNRLDRDVVAADPSGETAGIQYLNEIEVHRDKRSLQPYWDILTEEEKRLYNSDSPIGRAIRGKARDGRYFNSDDAIDFVKGFTVLPLDGIMEVISMPSAFVAERIAQTKGDPYDYSNVLPRFYTFNNTQRSVSQTADDEVKWISDKTGVPEWAVGFGVDFGTDPLTWTPLVATKAAKVPGLVRSVASATKSGIKKLPSKINPRYYNPTTIAKGDPERYFRTAGKNAFEDFASSGVLRTQAEITETPIVGLVKTRGEMKDIRNAIKEYNLHGYTHPTQLRAPYFSRGKITDVTKGADDYLFRTRPERVGHDAFTKAQHHYIYGSGNSRVPTGQWGVMDALQRSADNFDVFKKSWWHGYKPVKQAGGQLPSYQSGGKTSWTDYISPMNWGVTNRDEAGDFKQAFRAARADGDDEFMWHGERYNTELAPTPKKPKEEKPFYNPSILKGLSEEQTARRQALLNAANVVAAAQGNDENLRRLLVMSAAMENTLGADPDAYGRDYTRGPMSIDNIAYQDLFAIREGARGYTTQQKKNAAWLNELGIDANNIEQVLRSDDPLAGMAAARLVYGRAPEALPSGDDPDALYNYYLKYYNKGGIDKYGGAEAHRKKFNDFYNQLYRQEGGEQNQFQIYKDYVYGVYDGTEMQKPAEKIYDKLNRVYYKEAKQSGTTVPNYILSKVMNHSG